MIDPRNLTVTDWADSMSYTLEKYGTITRLNNPDEWQGWALEAISMFTIGKYNPPNPMEYQDWREWAFAFIRTVQLPGG
jgi:hypothetical protein